MNKKTSFLTKSALVGALYVVLTLSGLGISFGVIQFRFSEALCILPVFSPTAIWGLFAGCIISNAVSVGLGATMVIDIFVGSVATLLGAIFTYYLRNIRFKNLPLLSLLPPVIFNALLVGAELALFILPDVAFWYSALSIGLSELIVMVCLGLPLFSLINKTNLFKEQ